jgi:hypothetical protein
MHLLLKAPPHCLQPSHARAEGLILTTMPQAAQEPMLSPNSPHTYPTSCLNPPGQPSGLCLARAPLPPPVAPSPPPQPTPEGRTGSFSSATHPHRLQDQANAWQVIPTSRWTESTSRSRLSLGRAHHKIPEVWAPRYTCGCTHAHVYVCWGWGLQR